LDQESYSESRFYATDRQFYEAFPRKISVQFTQIDFKPLNTQKKPVSAPAYYFFNAVFELPQVVFLSQLNHATST
jgi:hypothetical protein